MPILLHRLLFFGTTLPAAGAPLGTVVITRTFARRVGEGPHSDGRDTGRPNAVAATAVAPALREDGQQRPRAARQRRVSMPQGAVLVERDLRQTAGHMADDPRPVPDIDRLRDALERKARKRNCPVCHGTDWAISASRDADLALGFQVVSLTCAHCGFVRQHATEQLLA